MSRCSKCGGNLISSAETCISCGKSNPLFRPLVAQYTPTVVPPAVNGRPRNFQRLVDPKIKITTPSTWGRIKY